MREEPHISKVSGTPSPLGGVNRSRSHPMRNSDDEFLIAELQASRDAMEKNGATATALQILDREIARIKARIEAAHIRDLELRSGP